MPENPSEPEKYSIDEMMDRLKNAPSDHPEAGELVTRPDGSQAMRVKKRKRRSSQPKKKAQQVSRRVRIVQVSAVLVLVFLAALIIGGGIVYANSRPFREALVDKIEQASGASVEMEQFRMNPQTAIVGRLALEWPAGNVLKSLALRGITADVFPSSFLGKSMDGDEISVSDGSLMLQIPQPGEISRNPSKSDAPLAIRFSRYRIPSFHLTLGPPTAPAIWLLKSEASLNPQTPNGTAQLSLYRGDLALAGWPKLRLDRALVEFRGDEIDFVGLQVLHETDSRGSFELNGTVYPYQPERLSTLDVRLQSFEISGIVGPSFGRIVSGRIDSIAAEKTNYLSFRPTANPATELQIGFGVSPSSQFELRGFPFLLGISQIFDDPWFLAPVFQSDARGTLARKNGVVTVRDLNLESKGRLTLRGEISMTANQQLTGNLQLGIAEAVITSTKDARLKSLFGPPVEGFRWLSLKIGGSAATPTDNFKELFAAAGTATPANPNAGKPAGSTFEQLTQPR